MDQERKKQLRKSVEEVIRLFEQAEARTLSYIEYIRDPKIIKCLALVKITLISLRRLYKQLEQPKVDWEEFMKAFDEYDKSQNAG